MSIIWPCRGEKKELCPTAVFTNDQRVLVISIKHHDNDTEDRKQEVNCHTVMEITNTLLFHSLIVYIKRTHTHTHTHTHTPTLTLTNTSHTHTHIHLTCS